MTGEENGDVDGLVLQLCSSWLAVKMKETAARLFRAQLGSGWLLRVAFFELQGVHGAAVVETERRQEGKRRRTEDG